MTILFYLAIWAAIGALGGFIGWLHFDKHRVDLHLGMFLLMMFLGPITAVAFLVEYVRTQQLLKRFFDIKVFKRKTK